MKEAEREERMSRQWAAATARHGGHGSGGSYPGATV